MREHGRRSLAGEPLMYVRHQHRGNEKKVNVGESRSKENSVFNSDNKETSLKHNKIDDQRRL